jgi:tRNA 2-thiouridine synthesizing protein A
MEHDEELDARGLLCPLPVLKAAKRLRGMEQGRVLRLVTDDPAAVVDVPHYCAESGNLLKAEAEENGAQIWWLERV